MSARLYVGNLSNDTSSSELNTLFSEIGAVESCRVITDFDTGRSKGFGFIEMESKEAADTAKEKLNGVDLNGRALKVSDAKPQGARNPAGYTPGRS